MRKILLKHRLAASSLILLTVIIFVHVFYSCKKAEEFPPTVVTESVLSITANSAIIGGTVTGGGGTAVIDRGVYWGTLPNSENSGIKLELGTGTGTFSYSLRGLEKNTKYYIKAYATNGKGTSYGDEVSFTTQANLPTVNTSIAEITANSVNVGGEVSDDGGYEITKRGLYWGKLPNPVKTGAQLELGSGAGKFSATLSNLDQSTYYVSTYATNNLGTGYGNELKFDITGFAQTIFSLRADGTILKNNQPFFPMGFYISRGSISFFKSQVESLAAGGTFNLISLPYIRGDNAGWTSFLDLCSSKNIFVISGLYYEGSADVIYEPVDLFKSHTAIFGWDIADDADDGYFTLGQLQDRHGQCKAKDPNHFTYIALTGYSLSRRNAADNFTSIPDVSGYEIYPITPLPDYDVTSSNALTQTYLRTLIYVNSAAKVNKPMIMISQNFLWQSPASNPRYPTVTEIRNMTYSGLAAGVKGILSYVYNTDFVSQTALWNENKAIRTDVTTLESALLNGTLTRVNTGDQELVESYWIYNNICYVVVVNTSYTITKSVSIPISASYSSSAAMFSRMPNTLSLSGGKLVGSISPEEVEVYKLK